MEHNHSREANHRSAIQEIPDISLNWKVHCHFNFLVSCAMEGKRGKALRLKLIVDSTVRVSVNMDDEINRSPGSTLTKGSPRRTAVWHKKQHSLQRHAHERPGHYSNVPHVSNLSTTKIWAVTFWLRPLYPRWINLRYPPDSRWGRDHG